MKKYIYIALALLSSSLGFTACGDDDEGGDSNYNIVADAGAAVAGDYNGTYTRTLNGESESANGTITLAQADKPYYVNVTFKAVPELKMEETTVKANIVQKNDNLFIISNTAGTGNALGTSFRIYVENGKMQANFLLKQKVGRKEYEYTYVFAN
jgi:hypothetical protein